jgi:hypothetical protein
VRFEDDDLESDLSLSLDDLLPLPDAEGIARWWRGKRDAFAAGVRHYAGRSVDGRALLAALADGPARRRHGIARELAIRSGGAVRIATRAFSDEQEAELAATSRGHRTWISPSSDWTTFG